MAHLPAIRCVLFDLGETLWTHVDSSVETAILQEQQRQVAGLLSSFFPVQASSEADFMELGRVLRQAMMDRYLFWRRQSFDQEPDARLVINEALHLLHLPSLDQQHALNLFEAFRPPLRRTRQLFPDTLETLAALQGHGIRLGCVTDRQYGGQPFLEELDALGLLPYFAPSAIVVSADCGKRKPHPFLFQQALSALQVPAEATAMVGDFLSRDIAGARRLHMTGIWKPKRQIVREVEATMSFNTSQERGDALYTYALQQEQMHYPEMPFPDLEAYMQPHAIIDHPSDLLHLLL